MTIARRDRELDGEYQAALRRLITYMMEDPRMIGQAIDILFVVKALERVGDHAKNIAEYVIYLVKGKDMTHSSLKHLAQERNRHKQHEQHQTFSLKCSGRSGVAH